MSSYNISVFCIFSPGHNKISDHAFLTQYILQYVTFLQCSQREARGDRGSFGCLFNRKQGLGYSPGVNGAAAGVVLGSAVVEIT
jgi:hypothetical protein